MVRGECVQTHKITVPTFTTTCRKENQEENANKDKEDDKEIEK
jgi:hypothetical protein